MKCTWQSMKPGYTAWPDGIDCFVAVERGADRDDPVAFDRDVGDGSRAADAVEHLAAADHDSGHRRMLGRTHRADPGGRQFTPSLPRSGRHSLFTAPGGESVVAPRSWEERARGLGRGTRGG